MMTFIIILMIVVIVYAFTKEYFNRKLDNMQKGYAPKLNAYKEYFCSDCSNVKETFFNNHKLINCGKYKIILGSWCNELYIVKCNDCIHKNNLNNIGFFELCKILDAIEY